MAVDFDSEVGEPRSRKSPLGEDRMQFRENMGAYNTGNTGMGKRRDFIDSMLTYVNKDLLISKIFYFFFFAAFGSLFPLMAVYFKQLGMNPTQGGLLIGFRPFIEFCSAPFWGGVADKWKKGKQLLLFSLFCWVVFTLSIAFVKPPARYCLHDNSTHIVLQDVQSRRRRDTGSAFDYLPSSFSYHLNPYGVSEFDSNLNNITMYEGGAEIYDYYDPLVYGYSEAKNRPKRKAVGQSPLHLNPDEIANKEEHEVRGLVSPLFTTIVYKEKEVHSAFLALLILVIIGEFFSAPAITLADTVTLTYLGEDTDNYGRQRMFGSMGWGLAMFFVGLALDHSDSFPDHPCGSQDRGEKNYIICFAIFSVLMSLAFIIATQFNFSYDGQPREVQLSMLKDEVKDKIIEKITRKKRVDRQRLVNESSDEEFPPKQQSDIFSSKTEEAMGHGYSDLDNQDGRTNVAAAGGRPLHISLDKQSDMVSDATKKSNDLDIGDIQFETVFMGKWMAVVKMLATPKYISVLFVAWFMGFGIGIIFTFLFWHLQDLGGTPTLFGLASVINHISELLAFFLTSKFIASYGHIKVLYAGLLGNVCRFLYISWLRNPFWVLPFEFVQGLTHAAVWATCCSYIIQSVPPALRSSAQGILQGLHHGLGRGCGAVFGGILVHYFGSEVTFRAYGVTCIFVLIGFFGVNYVIHGRDHLSSFRSNEPHQILQEASHLAPHGVPANPLSRNLSNHRLAEADSKENGVSQSYGATMPEGFLAPKQSSNKSYAQDGPAFDHAFNPNNPFTDPYQGSERVVMGQPPDVNTTMYQQQPGQRKNPLFDYSP